MANVGKKEIGEGKRLGTRAEKSPKRMGHVSDPRLTRTRLIASPIGAACDAVIADRAPTSPFPLFCCQVIGDYSFLLFIIYLYFSCQRERESERVRGS